MDHKHLQSGKDCWEDHWESTALSAEHLPPQNSQGAASILKDPTHPRNGLFTLLPSGQRHKNVKSKTTRLKNSSFPTPIRLLNRSLQSCSASCNCHNCLHFAQFHGSDLYCFYVYSCCVYFFSHRWHSVASKGRISLYRETCFLTVHITLNLEFISEDAQTTFQRDAGKVWYLWCTFEWTVKSKSFSTAWMTLVVKSM